MQWSLKNRDGSTRLEISGDITEEADFDDIVLQPLTETIIVDVGNVDRINSCGVREWLKFVQLLNSGGRTLNLERCAPEIVCQLNTLLNFVGRKGRVLSVLAPYYCSNCEREHLELIELAVRTTLERSLPCPSCTEEMEFDDIPEAYLSFLPTL